jgi:NAD(P)-dependent dehydrogenase (short-subunit alcohol dehydrogenase family)
LGHDLTNEKFVKDWFKKNKASHLVNLFGLNEHIDKKNNNKSKLFDVSLKSFDNYLKLNVTSLFSVCREYARHNKKGNIINFSSIAGIVSPDPRTYNNGMHKHAGYCVSKSAVTQLTKYLAVHLSPNIRVNCIIPGGVKSNQDKKFIKKYSSKVPLGRMMNSNEINGIIKFLCSEESSYCTGSQIVLDGGYTIW